MSTLVIHTGGTIGMVQTATGFAPATGVVEAALDTLPVRSGLTVQTLDPLIDSANASPADWDRIAAIIAARHDEFDNFVITHGTDTLAYTAAALCFALEGLGKPVILTGAMLPLTVEGSRRDAEPDRCAGRRRNCAARRLGPVCRPPSSRRPHP